MQQMNTDLLAAMKREKRKTRLLVCCQLFCWPDKAWTVHSLLAATSCTGLGSSTSASHTQGQCLLQQDKIRNNTTQKIQCRAAMKTMNSRPRMLAH